MNAAAAAIDLLTAPLVQGRVTGVEAHRPWPLPRGPWVMAQTWMDLLFAHWSVDPSALGDVVPSPLELDTFDGRAWIGVTPFTVRNLRLRPTWPVPWLSAFGEINVRTYASVQGKPGIWFFSLDAAARHAVAVARRWYRLPYFRSQIDVRRGGDIVEYRARRIGQDGPPARFGGAFGPEGDVFQARPGTLEHFLTERYCLYTLDGRGRVLRGEIHHQPWPLQPAWADIAVNTMADETGVQLDGAPHLHYAKRQDVVFWQLRAARS